MKHALVNMRRTQLLAIGLALGTTLATPLAPPSSAAEEKKESARLAPSEGADGLPCTSHLTGLDAVKATTARPVHRPWSSHIKLKSSNSLFVAALEREKRVLVKFIPASSVGKMK